MFAPYWDFLASLGKFQSIWKKVQDYLLDSLLVWANCVIHLIIETLFYDLTGVFWLREIVEVKFYFHASLVGLVLLDH